MTWKEITIYVHGITPEPEVGPHSSTYKKLHDNVNEALKKLDKPTLGKPVMIEWGWEKATGKNKFLAKSERKVADLTLNEIKHSKDFTFSAARLAAVPIRKIFLYGVADIFYYISEDGKKSVRKTVFDQVLKEIMTERDGEGISLTCVGHSAGSVVLHDLLYNIFGKAYDRKAPPTYEYVNKGLLSKARSMAKENNLRLYRFYTFGSPITPTVFRSHSMIEKTMKKEKDFLDPYDIGLRDRISRWVNFWDKDDIISYPVSFLYDSRHNLIEDKCVDVSDSLLKAHGAYWASKKVADYIAETY